MEDIESTSDSDYCDSSEKKSAKKRKSKKRETKKNSKSKKNKVSKSTEKKIVLPDQSINQTNSTTNSFKNLVDIKSTQNFPTIEPIQIKDAEEYAIDSMFQLISSYIITISKY